LLTTPSYASIELVAHLKRSSFVSVPLEGSRCYCR